MAKKKKNPNKKCRWIGLKLIDDISKYEGFVYIIKNNENSMYYIGKKSFWSNRTLPPLKGKTQKRHVRTESNWKEYMGSSNWLKEDIEKYGEGAFTKQVLKLCKSKFELAYEELMWQLKLDVLNDLQSYNGIIHVRLSVKKNREGIVGEVEDES